MKMQDWSSFRILLAVAAMLLMIYLASFLTGCTRETVREVPVPARIPSLCTSECPLTEAAKPATNGELAEAWAARGEAIACYKARQACVREMAAPPGGK